MRPAWARRPDAATAIVFRKVHRASPFVAGMPPSGSSVYRARSLDQREPARVERGRGLVVHGVRRHLEHLVLKASRIAGWPRFEPAVEAEPRRSAARRTANVTRIRARERQRARRRPGLVEIQWDEIAWREFGSVGGAGAPGANASWSAASRRSAYRRSASRLFPVHGQFRPADTLAPHT